MISLAGIETHSYACAFLRAACSLHICSAKAKDAVQQQRRFISLSHNVKAHFARIWRIFWFAEKDAHDLCKMHADPFVEPA